MLRYTRSSDVATSRCGEIEGNDFGRRLGLGCSDALDVLLGKCGGEVENHILVRSLFFAPTLPSESVSNTATSPGPHLPSQES